MSSTELYIVPPIYHDAKSCVRNVSGLQMTPLYGMLRFWQSILIDPKQPHHVKLGQLWYEDQEKRC